MTNTLEAAISLDLAWLDTEAVGGAQQTDAGSRLFTHLFQHGAGAYQANKKYQDRRTLAASASETLDFTALTQEYLDATSSSYSFSAIKALVIRNRGTQTSQKLSISTVAPTNPLDQIIQSGTLRVFYDDIWLVTNRITGWPVSGSAKELEFANLDGANALTYDILVLGV